MKTLEEALMERHFTRRRNTLRYLGHDIPEAIRQMLWKELMEQEAEYLSPIPNHSGPRMIDAMQADIAKKIEECRTVIKEAYELIDRLYALQTHLQEETS